jgi:hypothetical protein
MTASKITTVLERELYDALKDMKRVAADWFETHHDVSNLPYDWQATVRMAEKAINRADGKLMGKIDMIKHVRSVSNLGLKEAKDLVEIILENAPKEDPASPGFDTFGYRIS